MISEWERAEHQRKLKDWARDYPFAAMVMFVRSQVEVLEYAEERFK